jgi:hypothetical protein
MRSRRSLFLDVGIAADISCSRQGGRLPSRGVHRCGAEHWRAAYVCRCHEPRDHHRALVDRRRRGCLLDAMRRGQTAMLDTLRDLPVAGSSAIRRGSHGTCTTPTPCPAKTAGAGSFFFLPTDRPTDIWEAINHPRLIDYPFTFIEMRVDENGDGEGSSRAQRGSSPTRMAGSCSWNATRHSGGADRSTPEELTHDERAVLNCRAGARRPCHAISPLSRPEEVAAASRHLRRIRGCSRDWQWLRFSLHCGIRASY